jgi:Uma2 family endonuclease
VEVVSPTDSAQEIQLKVDDYLSAACTSCGFYPKTRSAMEFRGSQARRLAVTDNLDGGDVVPGFALPIASIFA